MTIGKLLELINKKANSEMSPWQIEGDYQKGWKDFAQSLILDLTHGESDAKVEDPSEAQQTTVKRMDCDKCGQQVQTYTMQSNDSYEVRCVHCNEILAEESI